MPTDLAPYRYLIQHDGSGTWIDFTASRLTGRHRIIEFHDEPGRQVAMTDSGLRVEFPCDGLTRDSALWPTPMDNRWQLDRHVRIVDAPALIAWMATPDPS